MAVLEESVYPMKFGVFGTSSKTEVGRWLTIAMRCFQSCRHCFNCFVIVVNSAVWNFVAYNGDNNPRPPGIPNDAWTNLPCSFSMSLLGTVFFLIRTAISCCILLTLAWGS